MAEYKLKIHGKGIAQTEYTLDQLKQGFGKAEVPANSAVLGEGGSGLRRSRDAHTFLFSPAPTLF
jgi:hypothetical protein